MSALQTKRQPATRQSVQHITDILASVTIDGQHAVDILSALSDALDGSTYSEYGSVGLADIASQMNDDIVAFETMEMCGNCSGSGEGQYDGTKCSSCGGMGVHPSPKQVAERESQEPS